MRIPRRAHRLVRHYVSVVSPRILLLFMLTYPDLTNLIILNRQLFVGMVWYFKTFNMLLFNMLCELIWYA